MKKTEYPEIGEVLYSGMLDNGLALRVIPKKEFSSFFAAFATNYGGACRRFCIDGEKRDTPAGVAHYLEHKMFDLPNGDNALNILSANGADPNAFTSAGMTCYHFSCTEGFEENLRMLLHFVSTPYFTDETVQKEQGIIGQEIRMGEDSPGLTLYYNLLRLLYDHHPIRDRIAGTVESIAEITAQTLYDCYRVFYAPSNMVLCVEGDVEPDEIARIAAEVLPAERAPIPAADFGEDEGLMPVAAFCSEAAEISAPQFLIGVKLPAGLRGEEKLRLHLTAMLALRLLCGSASPFFTQLYEEGLLNMDFEYDTEPAADTLTVILGGESRDPEAVLARFRETCERTAGEGFDGAAFERAKRASLGARLRALEDFDGVCVDLATGVFAGFCVLDAFRLLAAVSAEDCRLFVREYLRPERMAMSVITPKKAQD